MKNQIVFLFLTLFTISCSQSDDHILVQEEVIGEWQISSFVINSCPDASDNQAFTQADEDGCIDIMGNTNCMSIVIFDNGTAEVYDGDTNLTTESERLTYKIDEVNKTISLCQESEDCVSFTMREDGLYNEMDEDGCICVLGFEKM